MRPLQTLTALVLSMALLAGCSSSAPNTSSESKLPDTPVDLVVYTTIGLNREALDEVIDLYESKHPNVNVRVKGATGRPDAAALEGSDLALVPDSMARALEEDGLARDLSSLRLPALDPSVAGVIDDLSKVDGRRFGLPVSLQPALFFMNEGAFTKAGVPVPSVDWTVQEFEQAMTQLKAAGDESRLNLNMLAEPLVRSFGGQIFDTATQQWQVDSPETQQALAAMGRMVKNGLLEFTVPSNATMTTFRVGGPGGGPALTPMLGGMSVSMPGMTVQPFPKGPGGRSVSVSGTMGVVLTTSANPEVAADFLKEMLASPEAQRAMALAGVRPLISDATAMANWRQTVGDRFADVIDLSLQNGYAGPTRTSEMLTHMAPYFQGTASLEQATAAMKAKVGQ